MSSAVFHYTGINDNPVGIWWTEADGLHDLYLDPEGPEATYGRQVMTQKLGDADWADFFESLEETTPHVSGWERLDLGGGRRGAEKVLKAYNR